MRTAQAVAAGDYNRGDIFPQQVGELVGLFDGTLPEDHLAHGVLLQPEIATRPSCDAWFRATSAACSPRSSAFVSRSRISSMRNMGIGWRKRIASGLYRGMALNLIWPRPCL